MLLIGQGESPTIYYVKLLFFLSEISESKNITKSSQKQTFIMPTLKPNLEALSYPPKPLSSYAKGAGLTRRRVLGNIKWNILRENFEISTWLAMGACLQCLLLSLPISRTFEMGPESIFLELKALKTFLVWQNLLPNPRARDLATDGNGPVQLYSIP